MQVALDEVHHLSVRVWRLVFPRHSGGYRVRAPSEQLAEFIRVDVSSLSRGDSPIDQE